VSGKKVDGNVGVNDFTQFINLDEIFRAVEDDARKVENFNKDKHEKVDIGIDLSSIFDMGSKMDSEVSSKNFINPISVSDVLKKTDKGSKVKKAEAKGTKVKDSEKVEKAKEQKEGNISAKKSKPENENKEKVKTEHGGKSKTYALGSKDNNDTKESVIYGDIKKKSFIEIIKHKEFIRAFIAIILVLGLGIWYNSYMHNNAIKEVDDVVVLTENLEELAYPGYFNYTVRFENADDKENYIRLKVDIDLPDEEKLTWLESHTDDRWVYSDGYLYYNDALSVHQLSSSVFKGVTVTKDKIIKGTDKQIDVSEAEYVISTNHNNPIEAFEEYE